jgi:hypothetical protein
MCIICHFEEREITPETRQRLAILIAECLVRFLVPRNDIKDTQKTKKRQIRRRVSFSIKKKWFSIIRNDKSLHLVEEFPLILK